MEQNENIISLCMCTGNDGFGWPWRRLADLKDGKFIPFEADNDLPYEYENRKSFPRLRVGEESYVKAGDVAVVAWHDEPNINDSTKVFCCLTPIDKEIIKVFRTKAESKEDVIEDLKKGMPFGDSDNDILYVFNTGIGRLQGILCQKGDLKVAGDKYILQPTVKSLSVYDISPSDLIVLDNIPYECRNLAYCEVLDGEKAFHYSNTVKSYKDCLSLLENNLPYAGVSHESKHTMASVLYSAYVNKLPLLLMGPSSKEIADTLSLSVTGKYANQLQCDGPCDIGIIRESYKSTGVLVVTNAFGSDWMISLLQELNQAKCLIVFVHPFIEDISIEASSLYSYCCPISTVDTVDNLADMNGVTGACLSDSFEAYVPTVKGSKRADELMAMSASKLFVRNLAYIEGNAASISGNEADIESFVTENIIEPYKALTQN